MRLGSVAHRVLERLINTRELFGEDCDESADAAWCEETAREKREAEPAGDIARYGEPESWPGYYVKKALLHATAARLADLLSPFDPEGDYRTEVPLNDSNSPLWGIPDLIVRASKRTLVIEYKSGNSLEPETGEVRPRYERQIQLYSYLEHQETGVWPHRGFLLAFNGPPLEVDVSEKACMSAVRAALGAVEVYNQGAGVTPDAAPSASTCRYCAFVPSCSAFWEESSEIADQGFVAIRGQVIEKRLTRLGGITLRIAPQAPSPFEGVTLVRRIDPRAHPHAVLVEAGDSVCLVGIRNRSTDLDTPQWEMGRTGAVRVGTALS